VGRKLYVGNLPDSAIEQDLSDKFAAFGTVKIRQADYRSWHWPNQELWLHRNGE